MANAKSQIIPIPLNGELNYSKLKTKVAPYEGFNDLNSPIFGEALSPLYMKDRSLNEPGNDRPYIKDGFLLDKKGQELLDMTSFKGLERKELNLKGNILAVFDEEHYVEVNQDKNYTVIHKPLKENELPTVLTFTATNAAYSEASQNLIFITERKKVHVYDATTLEEITNAASVDNIKCNIKTFYDPYSDWQVLSLYEPFGDWDYRKEAGFNTPNEDYDTWETDLEQAKTENEAALRALEDNDTEYNRLKREHDAKYQYLQDKRNRQNSLDNESGWSKFWWSLTHGHDFNTDWLAAYNAANAAQKDYDAWMSKNGEAYKQAEKNIQPFKDEVEKTGKRVDELRKSEPSPYLYTAESPYIFSGKVGRTFNYIYDKRTKRLYEKTINIPFTSITKDSYGPSGDSYIFTGIYDVGFKQSQGKWQQNTDTDFIRYRVGVVPHNIVKSSGSSSSEKFSFTLNYTPKIYFRQRNVNFTLNTGANVKAFTKTYITNSRKGLYGDVRHIYFSGTGKYNRTAIWGKVGYNYVEGTAVNFNNFNLFHDYGDTNYNFYSPFTLNREYSGNCRSDAEAGENRIITEFYNYEVSTNNILYKKPVSNGEVITLNEPNNIFREIVNNGVLSNVSIAEDRYKIGTLLETANTIDINIPIYYKYGRNGQEIVFKNSNDKWIDIKVTDEVKDIKVLNEDYVLIYTTNQANCIRLEDNKIKHFAPDWNNRFSLVGSPYAKTISPLKFVVDASRKDTFNNSALWLGTSINASYEITGDPILGYTAPLEQVYANEDNITPVAYVGRFDEVEIYYADISKNPKYAEYYISLVASSLDYRLYTNVDIADARYVSSAVYAPGLFCKIKPSNFGKWYLDDGNTYHSLLMYNGRLIFGFTESSLIDDIKDLFTTGGQLYAITKSDYLYHVSVLPNGVVSLEDALLNVKGLKFCGAIPEMAIFYSPSDKMLKRFTSSNTLQDMYQATLIDEVNEPTYNPQTAAIYLPTDNGLYVFSSLGQYRLDVYGVREVYFGGEGNKHIYIDYLNKNKERTIRDYVYDKPFVFDETDEYEIQPLKLTTKYYGAGNNAVSNIDCIYFRLYSDIGPFDAYMKFKEYTLTDGVYTSTEKTLKVGKAQWDKNTNTAYVKYQPAYQKSVGISIEVETTASISEINFGVSSVDTISLSRPTLNA